MPYIPSKREVLEAHYTPKGDPWKGQPSFDYNICNALAIEGLMKESNRDASSVVVGRYWAITEKGICIMELLTGQSHSLPFRAPNWVMEEVTK